MSVGGLPKRASGWGPQHYVFPLTSAASERPIGPSNPPTTPPVLRDTPAKESTWTPSERHHLALLHERAAAAAREGMQEPPGDSPAAGGAAEAFYRLPRDSNDLGDSKKQ